MRYAVLYLLLSLAAAWSSDTPPQADISNGAIHARFYLPDPQRGYYRGTRFDWSGVMPVLEWRGHTYCGQWFDHYAPTIHDAIMGPVESFAPIERGSSRIVIGVGRVSKPDSATYNAFRYYPIEDPGVWRIKTTKTGITFTQTLQNEYVYKKTIRLDAKGFTIAHELTNKGGEPIHTTVYDHNLFILDSQRISPAFRIKLPWTITGATETRNVVISDSSVHIEKHLEGKQDAYAILQGGGAYDIREQNQTAGVEITADRPLDKLVFWGNARTACPEPYIKLDILPGETTHWTITYTFYTP